MSEPAELSADFSQQAQQELLESCLDLMFDAYDSALAERVVQPVVFLLDCEDPIGEEIASGWLGAAAVRDAVAEQKLEADPEAGEEPMTTVFAHAFSLVESRQEVPEVFPYLAPVFEQAFPSDGFLAIAVTAGGASVFTVPLTARESS
jgi:hypothetical protein